MLEAIHEMAVQRVRESECPRDVIARFGMHRCTIYGWIKAARGRGRGLKIQFAKPGILPRFASKRARQSRTTFVATSTRVLVAAAHPCAGAVLQTALKALPGCAALNTGS